MFLFLCAANFVDAQSRPPHPIQVLVSPDKPDWNYQPGEEATFRVTILKHQVPITASNVKYKIGLEKMAPMDEGDLMLKQGVGIVKGKLDQPGFLRCEIKINLDGKEYRGLATAAYTPEQLKATQSLPNDFLQFWEEAKALAAKVPLEPRRRLLPELSTEKVKVYELSIQNQVEGSRIYGVLCVPAAPGKHPAVLQVPGAGVRSYQGIVDLAEQGIITLQIGIHGVPVRLADGVYNDLRASSLNNYMFNNLDDRDQYYYKRVYLGCLRAVDYLVGMEEYDGTNLAVWGGSQGGALSIVTAALDKRIKYLVSLYPALCDLTGYLHGRAGGWPHMFTETNKAFTVKEDKITTSAYYDVVNFARYVKVPGFYTWGYNDETCPPTSYYSAYNIIQAPKELLLMQETGHWTFPEQQAKIYDWLKQHLVK